MTCSPIINGKEEARICGYGPLLIFYIEDDKKLAVEREIVIDHFELSFEMAQLYIDRFEFIRQFFAEDSLVEEDSIREEKGKVPFKQHRKQRRFF